FDRQGIGKGLLGYLFTAQQWLFFTAHCCCSPIATTVTKEDTKESDNNGRSSDESDNEEPQKKKIIAQQPSVTPNAGKNDLKAVQDGCSSDEGSSDDEPTKAHLPKSWQPTQVPKESCNSEVETSEDEGSSEEDASEEEKEQPSKTLNKNSDVDILDVVSPKAESEHIDAEPWKKSPQNPFTQAQPTGSKTLFVGNLSFSVEQTDVEEFFKDAGEIAGIRFALDKEGAFKGYGHVEFCTVEAAQKALKLDGKDLLGRRVRLDLARERGSYIPVGGKDRNPYKKGGRAQGQTIFVRGFDKNSGEDQVRSALEEHFGACGEISRLSIPREYGADELKGIAFIYFKDTDSVNRALELSRTELGGYTLTVEEAKQRDNRENTGSGRGGGRHGGRDGGGWFGSRGARGGPSRFGGAW
ncbi:hypothetical protein U1Q18_029821, partial [Sarracenia purpurea var. burkii]